MKNYTFKMHMSPTCQKKYTYIYLLAVLWIWQKKYPENIFNNNTQNSENSGVNFN